MSSESSVSNGPSTAAPVQEVYVGKPTAPVAAVPETPAKQQSEQAQPVGTETPAEQSQEVEAKGQEQDPNIAARFAALTRKEKALIDREKSVKDQMTKADAYEAAIKNVKQDPLAALASVGLTFEDLAQAYLRSQNPDYVPTPEEKIKEIEAKLAAKEQEEQDKLSRAEQERLKQEADKVEETINSFKQGIKEAIEAERDLYELIAINNAYDSVYDVIESYYEQTNQILDVKTAAQHVEDYLTEEASKLMNTKKFAPKVAEAPAKPAEKPVEKLVEKPVENNVKTLTNSAVSTTTISSKPQGLSMEESKRRAASLLKWT